MISKFTLVLSLCIVFAEEDINLDESGLKDELRKYLTPSLGQEKDFAEEMPNSGHLTESERLLKEALDFELKKNEDQILKAIIAMKSSNEDLFLKEVKEKWLNHKSHEEVSKLMPGHDPLLDKLENTDVRKYLAESIHHGKEEDKQGHDPLLVKLKNMDVRKYLTESAHHGEEENIPGHSLKVEPFSKIPTLENMDVRKFLVESINHGEDDDRLGHSLKVEPFSKIPALEKIDFKPILLGEEVFTRDDYLKMKEILKNISEKEKAASSFHSEEVQLKSKVPYLDLNIPHSDTMGKEHLLNEGVLKKHIHTDKRFEAAEEKTRKSHHEEAEIHKKDFIYDALLKGEEDRELRDEIEPKKSVEIGSESLHHFFPKKGKKADIDEKTLSVEAFLDIDAHATRDFIKEVGKEINKEEAVGHELADSIKKDEIYPIGGTYAYAKARSLDGQGTHDFIKEVGKEIKKEEAAGHEHTVSVKKDEIYPIGGTYAYAKAKEKAQKDAKIPAVEDKVRKEVLHDEEAKIPGEGKVKIDISIGKEIVGEKIDIHRKDTGIPFAVGKDIVSESIGSRKIYEEKDIGSSLAKEGKAKEEHTGKEVHFMFGAVDDEKAVHQVDAERGAHSMRNKFLSFMGHFLHSQQCHLQSMKPGELLSIVHCVSRSKDPVLCEKFVTCEKRKPLQVIAALEKCQKETIPGRTLGCSNSLYPSPDISQRIFQCVAKSTRPLLAEEKKQMVEFEECARVIKKESCGRLPWG